MTRFVRLHEHCRFSTGVMAFTGFLIFRMSYEASLGGHFHLIFVYIGTYLEPKDGCVPC